VESLVYVGGGLALGLSGGLSPGPLTALVLSETLRHGRRAGLLVAIAPLLTDLPIIALWAWLFSLVPDADGLLAVLSVAGFGFLLHIARTSWRDAAWRPDPSATASDAAALQSLRKAVVTNLLNPHPWLFWATIGTPSLLRSKVEGGLLAALGFGIAFFGGLVGTKAVMALVTDGLSTWMLGRAYVLAQRSLAVALAGFAVWILVDGLRLLAGP
jgi:threonine/homoserine/homoserine lactone efflux protein